MAGSQMELLVNNWEAKFLATFDEICIAVCRRIEALTKLPQPLTTSDIQPPEATGPTDCLESGLETWLAQSPHSLAHLVTLLPWSLIPLLSWLPIWKFLSSSVPTPRAHEPDKDINIYK
ncbi:Hypothetical predicted protein, partial [Pelobates cultripes]